MPDDRIKRTRAAYEGGTLTPQPKANPWHCRKCGAPAVIANGLIHMPLCGHGDLSNLPLRVDRTQSSEDID